MPRLLIVTTVPATLTAFLLPYAHHFRALGWRVDGMANGISADAGCQKAFDRIFEIDWSRNPVDLRNFSGRPEAIRTIVEREGYDLVHVHTPVAAFVTRFALRGLKQPQVIYTAHGFHFHAGGSALKNRLYLTLEQIAGKWTDHLVVINEEDEDAARRHALVPSGHLHYMPGIGVDTVALRPDYVAGDAVAKVRTELGLGHDDRLFLMVAELIPRKRHLEAIEAFARLNRPNTHLALAGTGPQAETLKALATECGVAGRVHFLGWRSDIPAIVHASCATLLPSEQEGLPRCVMESMALGVPVIGTDIRGMRELLRDGCGLLVPVGNAERLSAAMARILDHPDEAEAMAQRGRRRIEAFDLGRVIELHEQLYLAALASAQDLAVPHA